MKDAKRLEILERAIGELKLTERGYVATGTHWRPAMRDLETLATDLRPKPPAKPKLIHPIPFGYQCTVGGDHRTAGDAMFAQNWARDFLVPAGTPFLCPEVATIVKLSGHDPADDKADRDGVFGWSIHFETPDEWHYFLTHLGKRAPGIKVGDRFEQGAILGWVGDQGFRPDHGHLGVTAPSGAKAPAVARMGAIVAAARVDLG